MSDLVTQSAENDAPDYRGIAESIAKTVIEDRAVWAALGWRGQSNIIDRIEARLREAFPCGIPPVVPAPDPHAKCGPTFGWCSLCRPVVSEGGA